MSKSPIEAIQIKNRSAVLAEQAELRLVEYFEQNTVTISANVCSLPLNGLNLFTGAFVLLSEEIV